MPKVAARRSSAESPSPISRRSNARVELAVGRTEPISFRVTAAAAPRLSMMHSVRKQARRGDRRNASDGRPALALLPLPMLVCLHIIILLHLAGAGGFATCRSDDVVRRQRWLKYAIASVGAFSTMSLLFILRPLQFWLLRRLQPVLDDLGFIWLTNFSKFTTITGWQAFRPPLRRGTVPASRPAHQHASQAGVCIVTPRPSSHLLKFILVLALGTIVVASLYNFRLVSIRRYLRFSQRTAFFRRRYVTRTGIMSTRAAAIRLRLLSGAQLPLVA